MEEEGSIIFLCVMVIVIPGAPLHNVPESIVAYAAQLRVSSHDSTAFIFLRNTSEIFVVVIRRGTPNTFLVEKREGKDPFC